MASGGGGQGAPNPGSDDSKYVIMFLLVAAAGYVIWVIMKPQLIWLTFGMDILEYRFLKLLGLLDPLGQRWMHYTESVHAAAFSRDVNNAYRPTTISWDSFVRVQEEIGTRMRWFWIPIALAFTLTVVFKMRGDGFRRQYSLTGTKKVDVFRFLGKRIDNRFLKFFLWWVTYPLFLREATIKIKKEWINSGASFAMYQAKHWREALTGAVFDPSNPDDPNMMPSFTPPEWLRKNNISLVNGALDQAGTLRAFAGQVGENWTNLTNAPLHVQAIMVMSALNVKRDKGLNKLRAAVAECYTLRPKAAAVEVPKLLEPFLANKKVYDNISKYAVNHAFTNTACIAVYGWGGPMEQWGGKGAVLSTSLFLWLKRVDRSLWYALNNVGRRAFHIEGAGAICHFFVERLYKTPRAEPHVDNALGGLTKYLMEQNIVDLDKHFNVPKDIF